MIGGGGYVHHATEEQVVSIHTDADNLRNMNGDGASAGGAGVQNLVGASEDKPCGGAGGGNGGRREKSGMEDGGDPHA